ncbi:histone-lysine N-methyltransferase SMYD3 [Colletotrichum liriopes]|uniref:Histone-lysine N-methyltransferase SMYD3 n=1 Tax=Colletotrichum liriopes TaxID=708192 RepID=A0AA37LV62_9PEZI|nr:histone-lysine N-methyltransferase SMYD3 [Colletotrichum liriopes]
MPSINTIGYAETENIAEMEEIARNCKDMGNTALKNKGLQLAWERYTDGLKIARQGFVFDTNPDLARDLSRNRAYVNLLLNRLDEAVFDAKAALSCQNDNQSSKDLDAKAYFRAGCAAYQQGEYKEARSFFEEQRRLRPDDKSSSVQLERVSSRIREKETGVYNLRRMKAGLSQISQLVDAANFTRKTEVKDSKGRGRGLFATEDIPAGEIVICEKAFTIESTPNTAITYDARDGMIRVSPIGLTASITQKLLDNPSQIDKVMDLYGDYQGDGGVKVSRTDEGPIVDVFRVHDIVSRNAFGVCHQQGNDGTNSKTRTGLWVWAAYINHSCVPNTEKENIGDIMILRAARPIATGEEILISYAESSDYDERQAALMTTWGFECGCALCTAEKADGSMTRKKRRELAGEAEELVKRVEWNKAKRLTIAKAQRLARDIENTYDGERYRGLPRMATQRIREWLTRARPQL